MGVLSHLSLLAALLLVAPPARAEWQEALAPGIDPATALRDARAALAETQPNDARRAARLAELGLVAFELNRTTEAAKSIEEALTDRGWATLPRPLQMQLLTALGVLDSITWDFAGGQGGEATRNGKRHTAKGWAAEARGEFAHAQTLAGPSTNPADPQPFVVRQRTVLMDDIEAGPTAAAQDLQVLADDARHALGEDNRITILISGTWAMMLNIAVLCSNRH